MFGGIKTILFFCFASVIVTLLAVWNAPVIALIAGILVALLAVGYAIFFRHKHRFFRLGAAVTSCWLTIRFHDIFAFLEYGDSTAFFFLKDNASSGFDACVLTLILALLSFDLFLDSKSFIKEVFGNLRALAMVQQQEVNDHGMATQVTAGDNSPVTINQTTNVAKGFDASVDEAAGFTKTQPNVAIRKLGSLQLQASGPRQKYRIHANMGNAFYAKGDHEQAAIHFLKAYDHAPGDEKGMAYRALSYLLAGDRANAKTFAASTLDTFPNSELANSVLIQVNADNTATQELFEKLPTPLKSSEEILLGAYVRSSVLNEFDFCETVCRRLVSINSQCSQYKSYLGGCLINKGTLAKQAEIRLSAQQVREVLIDGIEMMSQAIHGDGFATKETQAENRFRRAVGHNLIGETDLARADFLAAVELAPKNHDIGYQFGLFLTNNDETDKALTVFETCSDLIGAKLMTARILHNRAQDGDFVRAIEILDPLLDLPCSHDHRDRFEVAQNYSRALLKMSGVNEALDFLHAVNNVDGVTKEILLALLSYDSGDLEASSAYANGVVDQAVEKPSQLVNMYLGQLLFNLRHYEEAIEVLKPVVTPSSFETGTDLILECASLAKDFKFILDFVRELRANGNANLHAIELEIATLEELNEFDPALDLLDVAIKESPDSFFAKTLRVRRSLIGLIKNRPELVESDEAMLPAVGEAAVSLSCQVARILAEGPSPISGARYAYELLRQNFGEFEPHLCMAFLFGVGDESFPEDEVGDTVKIGCAVRFRIEGEDVDEWLVIEDSPNPLMLRNEIAPDSEIAKDLLGKKVGDKFYRRKNSIQDRVGKINLIWGKLRFRKWDSLLGSEKRFPGREFGMSFTTPTLKNGEIDTQAFLKMLSRVDDPIRELNSMAKRLPVTVSMFANHTGRSVFEAVMHYITTPDLFIHCCSGQGEERDHAVAAVEEHEAIVVDSSALTTLYTTNAFRDVSNLTDKRLLITETAIGQFQVLAGAGSHLWAKRTSSSLSGRPVFIEKSDEEVENAKAIFAEFLDWIETNFEVVGGIGQADLPADFRQKTEHVLGAEAVESIGVMRSQNAVLWTDDIGVATFANQDLQAPRVWTDVMLEWLCDKGQLESGRLTRIKLDLVHLGYRFTRLGNDDFIKALELAELNPMSYPLNGVIDWFHNSRINANATLSFAQLILTRVWRDAILGHQPINVTRALIRSIRKRPDATELLNLLRFSVPSLFEIDTIAAANCRDAIDRETQWIDRRSTLVLPGDPDWFV